jgi:hypothetical protein
VLGRDGDLRRQWSCYQTVEPFNNNYYVTMSRWHTSNEGGNTSVSGSLVRQFVDRAMTSDGTIEGALILLWRKKILQLFSN